LRRRGAPPEVAATVVAELESRGYLDDAQFARRWVETRTGVRRLGSARLRAELRARGVDPELAEAAIREMLGPDEELARALEAGRKRLRALARRDTRRAPARLRDHLRYLGYPSGVVTRVLRTLGSLDSE